MNQIELTPAELELIQVKRQEEELAAIEAAAKKQRRIEQEVARLKTYYQENAMKQNEQTAAAREFAKSIAGGQLKTNSTKQTRVVTYGSEEVDTIDYFEIVSYIMLNGYKIDVKEHIVYSKWGRGGRSQGYKMYVSGNGIDYKTSNRGYKNAKKVVELIEDTIESIKAKELRANKQKNAVKTTIDNLTQQFPGAQVIASRGCRINPYGKAYNRYIDYDKVEVKLSNGIEIEYQVYEDGSMSRLGIKFPKHETVELITMLNNLEFSK